MVSLWFKINLLFSILKYRKVNQIGILLARHMSLAENIRKNLRFINLTFWRTSVTEACVALYFILVAK